MKRIWGIAAVAALALVGCSAGDSPGPTSSTVGSTASSGPVSPTEDTSAPTPEPTPESTTPSVSQIVESVCEDAAGDGDGAADLERVTLLSDGELLFITYKVPEDLSSTGTVLYSVTAWNSAGDTGYQMGTKFQGDVEIANYIFSFDSSSQKNLDNGTVAVDGEVNARYPLKDLQGLGDEFTWSAAITVDGTDVDRCPDGEGKTVHTNS
jgi:hypothetical protein